MSSIGAIMTSDQLSRLPGLSSHSELINGVLVLGEPAGWEHSSIAARLLSRITVYVETHGLGIVTSEEGGYVLRRNPDTVRAPDIGFVCQDRVPASGVHEGFFDGAPDFAAEVVSPRDHESDMMSRVADFLAAGTRMVWVLYPKRREAVVYEPGVTPVVYTTDEQLDGGGVLPGFRISLREVFDGYRGT